MRVFTMVGSAVFVALGIALIFSGESFGWLLAGFFGLCLLIAIYEPRLPRLEPQCEYRLLITPEGIACEHPVRKREAIRWEDVIRIWYVTTSDGPRLPDEWLLLDAEHGGCSFPMEVKNMKAVWDELEQRFPGFDYGPIIRGGTVDARHLCWERGGNPA